MALIVYVGAHDCVDVQVTEPRLFAVTAYRGTPVDVPQDIAAGLLAQTVNWQPAVVLSKTKRGEPATTEEVQ